MAKREVQKAAKAMLPRERSAYSAIVDRPPLKLPGGARVVFWTIVNLEVWDIGKPMARQVLPPPTGVTQLPDVPNWSWHEYGMRVGVWRFFDLFKRQNIRPTLAINARVCEDYARVAEEARKDRWEFMGHSYEQGPIHKEPNQKAMIARSLDVLERFSGQRPVGWFSGRAGERTDRRAGHARLDCVGHFRRKQTRGSFPAEAQRWLFFPLDGMGREDWALGRDRESGTPVSGETGPVNRRSHHGRCLS